MEEVKQLRNALKSVLEEYEDTGTLNLQRAQSIQLHAYEVEVKSLSYRNKQLRREIGRLSAVNAMLRRVNKNLTDTLKKFKPVK
jgi:uncharacterized protein YPO0396